MKLFDISKNIIEGGCNNIKLSKFFWILFSLIFLIIILIILLVMLVVRTSQ
ncbi:MAG: hypothetical protein GBAus27B_000369 [Mycoplasmataceae bacterium]|nr:MAG: hypothetical protein GBAus27B_000369 [Mycoplasmataceae bacterium]